MAMALAIHGKRKSMSTMQQMFSDFVVSIVQTASAGRAIVFNCTYVPRLRPAHFCLGTDQKFGSWQSMYISPKKKLVPGKHCQCGQHFLVVCLLYQFSDYFLVVCLQAS